MPKRNKIQVHFETEKTPYFSPVGRWEHRIAVYPDARDEVLLGWFQSQPDAESRDRANRLVEAMEKHWLDEAETCRRQFRYLAAIDAYRQALRLLPNDDTQAKLNEAVSINSRIEADVWALNHHMSKSQFKRALEAGMRILELKPDYANVLGRVGTLLAIDGKPEAAMEYWQKVAQQDPDDQYGESMIGWMNYLKGDYVASLRAYERAQTMEPYFAKIDYHIGLVLMKLERWPEAIARFVRAIEIDPGHFQSCHSLSLALRDQGETLQAIEFAKKAVELTNGENVELLISLAETYAETNQHREGLDILNKAIQRAAISNPQLLPELKTRAAAWRRRLKID